MTHHGLAPFNPPLGPQPPSAAFYSPNAVTLHMKEKIFSLGGDSFTIKTTDGHDVCQCKGKVLSAHDKKRFTDMAGNEIFEIKNKMLAISRSFHAESAHGHSFEVKGHFTVIGSRSTVEFKNASDGQHVELEVQGSWMDRSAEITFGGRPVAHISRSFFNVRQIFGDKDTYFVTVAPNVDLTLIAGLCVCLDERENDK